MATCRTHDCKQVTLHLRLPMHLANGTLQFKHLVGSDHWLQRLKDLLLFETMENSLLFLFRRIADLQAQQKTVKLGFGKRKSAFQFNRVLRSNNQERLRKGHSGTLYCYLPLGHGLQQCRLSSGSGPINFVYQKNLCKKRALPENKFVTALIEVTD